MPTVTQLVVEVGEDTSKAQAGLKGINDHVSKSQGFFSTAAAAATGFFGVQAVLGAVTGGWSLLTGAIGDVVQKASESESVMANTTAVLKSTHGAAGVTAQMVQELASKFQNLTGIDDEVVQSTENMLLTFTNISSKVFPQATEAALNMATSLKTDPVQASIMLGKALNDPVKGVTALQRVGVTFDEHQKQAIKTDMARGDSLAAQKVILQELGKEFGGQAAAAGETYAGKMALLQGKIDNVKEALGAKLLPVLISSADRFMPLIDAAGNILPPILERLVGLFTDAGGPIQTVATLIGNNLGPAVAAVGAFFQTTLVPAFSQLHGTAGQILPILAQLGQTFTSKILPAVFSVATIFITQLLPTMLRIWTTVATALLPALMNVASMILGQVVPAVLRLVAAVAPVLVPILSVLGFVLGNVVVPVLGIVVNVLVTVIGWITTLIGWIGSAIAWVGNFGSGWSDFVGIIRGAVSAGFNFIRGIIDGAVKFVAGLFVWLYGHNVYFHMLVDNIRTAFNGARSFIMSIWSGITGWLGTQFNLIKSIAQTAWNNFVGVIKGAIGAAASAVGSVVDAVLGPVKDLGGKLFDAAKAAIQMIIDGIRSMIGAVGKAAGDVAGAIWKNLGFHSPTEEGPGSTADQWMPALGGMLAGGLHAQRRAVAGAAQALAGDMQSALGGADGINASLAVSGGSLAAIGGGGQQSQVVVVQGDSRPSGNTFYITIQGGDPEATAQAVIREAQWRTLTAGG
jgi:phage-related protein